MSSLSAKSAEELCQLLDEHGINHGPIVDSTRKLYEKKLTEAMAKATKSSSDKTFYREEQEEITYVTYHPPAQHEVIGDVTRRSKTAEYAEDANRAYEPITSHTQTAYQSTPYSRSTAYQSTPYSRSTAYQSTPYSRSTAYTTKSSQQDAKPVVAKSEGSRSQGAPGWLRVLVFIIIAVFLYYVYSNMESVEENPFNKIDG